MLDKFNKSHLINMKSIQNTLNTLFRQYNLANYSLGNVNSIMCFSMVVKKQVNENEILALSKFGRWGTKKHYLRVIFRFFKSSMNIYYLCFFSSFSAVASQFVTHHVKLHQSHLVISPSVQNNWMQPRLSH